MRNAIHIFIIGMSFAAGTILAATPSFTVEVSGSGKPVILIPGLGCSSEVWRETIVHLNKEGYQTHALTLAGFGGVAPLPTPNDHFLATVREDLVTYIKTNKLDHPVVMGHSLGGFLALWLAETNPEIASRIISVDGLPFLTAIMNPTITPEGVKRVAADTRAQFESATDEQFKQRQRASVASMIVAPENVEREMKVATLSDRNTETEAMVEMMSTDLRPQLTAIKAPVLVMGTWISYKEYGATHESGFQLYSAQFGNLPTVKLVMNDTSKHFIQLDAPDWFYNQVDQFLQGK